MQSALLVPIENEQGQALRRQMKEAFCVFEFVVLAVAPQASVDLELHRQALSVLYRQLQQERRDALRRMREDPRHADIGDGEPMRWEVERAQPRELDAEQIRQLTLIKPAGDSLALYPAFSDPPYGTQFAEKGECPEAIFQQWLALLGLEPEAGPVVIDWVSNLELEWVTEARVGPEIPPWSDYFDEGLEWWGVWCLSIWNPERRTLAVLMASATD
ncbi:hypothetical protein [Pseudomonas sp. Fl4BN1]|uniref:hypothetical protein n=1 Tax=Pseudomonas sp. Fl4BN1 TaxID=2697651 RepID=UPI002113BE71|nr:hypothetical protein [Pseudomonas sp. Fl4BN1]